MPSLLTVAEAAAVLRLHPNTVTKLCQEGKLPAVRVGDRVWRINAEQLERMFMGPRERDAALR